MPNFWRNPIGLGIAALLGVILFVSSVFIVPETEQAVILRFEKPVGTINRWKPNQPFGQTDSGLAAKIPFVDKIVWVDKHVLGVDLNNQQVLSTDQLRLEVDAFALFRIVDPLKAVVSTGSSSSTEERVADQLRPLLGTAVRNELGRRQFSALLSPERGRVMDNIQAGLQQLARQYGAQIVDVRIRHADLPEGSPLDSALNRMKTARQQEAATIRAQGEKSAQIIRAEADANAARIYADAFNKDPDFYDFYRAMQSYRYTFTQDSAQSGETQIILSPSDDYLRQLTGRGRPR